MMDQCQPGASDVAAIKCREGLGRLRGFGIEASRQTARQAREDGPDAFLVDGAGHAWLGKIWSGDSLQPRLFDSPDAPATLDETIATLAGLRQRQPEEQPKSGRSPYFIGDTAEPGGAF